MKECIIIAYIFEFVKVKSWFWWLITCPWCVCSSITLPDFETIAWKCVKLLLTIVFFIGRTMYPPNSITISPLFTKKLKFIILKILQTVHNYCLYFWILEPNVLTRMAHYMPLMSLQLIRTHRFWENRLEMYKTTIDWNPKFRGLLCTFAFLIDRTMCHTNFIEIFLLVSKSFQLNRSTKFW